MKNRLLTYLLLAAASLVALSCQEKGLDTDHPVPQDGIVLHILTDGPTTRVEQRNGEVPRNENLVVGNKVDIFFFKDSTETAAIRKFVPNITVENNYVSIPVTFQDVSNIFNGIVAGQSTCNVLIIANYSFGDSSVYSGCSTRGDLLNLPLDVAHWSDATQSSFVMRGSATLTLLTPKGSTPASGDVRLRRVASKISFNLTVASSAESDGGTVWSPNTESMSVYMVYAMRQATLGGSPTAVPTGLSGVDYTVIAEAEDKLASNDGEYLYEYQARSLVPSGTTVQRTHNGETENCEVFVAGFKDINGTVLDSDSPFYSYPSNWDFGSATEPYLKLIIPWTTTDQYNTTRTKYYYYKIPFSVNTLESNYWYRIYIDVQILGSEEPVPPLATIKYCVSDWEGEVDMTTATVVTEITVIPATVVAARYLSVPITEYVLYNTDDLVIPITSSHEVEVVGFTVDSDAYTSTHDVDANYVGTNPRIYNPFTTTLDTGNIRVVHPDYSTDPASPSASTFTFGSAAAGTYGWSVTAPGTGTEQVVVHHKLNRDLSSSGYDVAPYTLRMRIRHKGTYGDSYFTDVTIEQRPPIMIYPEKNAGGTSNYGYAFVNGAQNAGQNYTRTGWIRYTYTCNDGSWTSTSNMMGNFTYYLGSSPSDLSNSNNKNTNMYIIETSVLPTTGTIAQYMLGDPRSQSIDNLNGTTSSFNTTDKTDESTWSNQMTIYKDWDGTSRGLLYYYPVGTATEFNNFIAPRLRIASSFGATSYMSYYDAFRRCASYQESGYPAGRWRIPTKAEIEYIAQLNSDEKIPLLLGSASGSTDYWCNSGYVTVEVGETPTYTNAFTTTEGYVRCVYDDWFWGESNRARLPEAKINTFTWGDQARSTVQMAN